MKTRGIGQASSFAGRTPDHAPEPVAPDVLVPVSCSLPPRRSSIRSTASSGVVRVGAPAVPAAALSGVVGGECAVPVLAASLVGLGTPGGIGLSRDVERWPGATRRTKRTASGSRPRRDQALTRPAHQPQSARRSPPSHAESLRYPGRPGPWLAARCSAPATAPAQPSRAGHRRGRAPHTSLDDPTG